jgi:hypothetical protein
MGVMGIAGAVAYGHQSHAIQGHSLPARVWVLTRSSRLSAWAAWERCIGRRTPSSNATSQSKSCRRRSPRPHGLAKKIEPVSPGAPTDSGHTERGGPGLPGCGSRREADEHGGEPRDMPPLPWHQFDLDEFAGVKVERGQGGLVLGETAPLDLKERPHKRLVF